MIGGERLDALHDRGIIECIGKIAGAKDVVPRQPELDIEAHDLRETPLPLVDADARFDAQVMDENRVHAALLESACG